MRLEGKVMNFLGDSITEGLILKDPNSNRYDNVLRSNCGLKATYNYGMGGTRIAHQSVPSENPRRDLCFCGRAYDMNPDADIIVVYGGVNDYLSGDAPIGQFGDATPATFYGAVRFLMDFLKTKYADATVVFMTPARLSYNGITGETPPNRSIKRADALPLLGYTDIIKKTAELYHIPVLDLYENLAIDPTIPEHKEKYTVDGLHFNDVGHHILAKCLQDFLESI